MKQSWIYFVANENVSGGLLRSQLLEPLKNSGLASKVKVINLVHPLTKVEILDSEVRILKVGLPARLYQFKVGGLLDIIVASYYASVLWFYVPAGARIAARSYFSALVVLILSKFKRIELVFDTRSQYVQENVSAGRLSSHSAAHRRWIAIEASLLKLAAKVIVVSDIQGSYYKSIEPSAKIEVIPCFAQPNYNFLKEDQRRAIRKKLGFAESDVVVCYYGSLDLKWNDINVYANFFAECLNQGKKICVITPSAIALRSDARLSGRNAFIAQIDDLSQARRTMAACDYGVVLMKKVDDWESRLSVKFAEYLSAGLQILVGEWVGAAVKIACQHFPGSSIILKGDSPLPPQNMPQIHEKQRFLIASKAETLFGHHQIKRFFFLGTQS